MLGGAARYGQEAVFGRHCLRAPICVHVKPCGQSVLPWQACPQKPFAVGFAPAAPSTDASPPEGPPRKMQSAPDSHSSFAEHAVQRTPSPPLLDDDETPASVGAPLELLAPFDPVDPLAPEEDLPAYGSR